MLKKRAIDDLVILQTDINMTHQYICKLYARLQHIMEETKWLFKFKVTPEI